MRDERNIPEDFIFRNERHEKSVIKYLESLDSYLDRIDMHLNEFGRIKLIDKNIDLNDPMDMLLNDLNSRVLELSTQYFSEIYSFVQSAYLFIADRSLEQSESSMLRQEAVGKGLCAIIDAFKKRYTLSTSDLCDYSEYSLVNSMIGRAITAEDRSNKEISGLLELRSHEIYLRDDRLKVTHNYLMQFVYDSMSLNDALILSMDNKSDI